MFCSVFYLFVFFASNIWQLVVVVELLVKCAKLNANICAVFILLFSISIFIQPTGIFSILQFFTVRSVFVYAFVSLTHRKYTAQLSLIIVWALHWEFPAVRGGGGHFAIMCRYLRCGQLPSGQEAECGEGERQREKATYFHITRANRLSPVRLWARNVV